MSGDLYRKTPVRRTDRGDPRGSTFRMALDGRDYLFLNVAKGSFRGGHYHPRETFHLVLKGRLWFEFVDTLSDRKAETIAEPMDVVHIPAGVAHLIKALEDSMFMEPFESLIEAFPPQRSIVDKFLRSGSG